MGEKNQGFQKAGRKIRVEKKEEVGKRGKKEVKGLSAAIINRGAKCVSHIPHLFKKKVQVSILNLIL